MLGLIIFVIAVVLFISNPIMFVAYTIGGFILLCFFKALMGG